RQRHPARSAPERARGRGRHHRCARGISRRAIKVLRTQTKDVVMADREPPVRSAIAIAACVAAACGGGQREQIEREAQRFECRSRRASYTVAHHLAADEIGVQIDCADAGPRIKRWRTDRTGKRQEDTRVLTPGEFDKVWREIDGTGWPY